MSCRDAKHFKSIPVRRDRRRRVDEPEAADAIDYLREENRVFESSSADGDSDLPMINAVAWQRRPNWSAVDY